MKLTALLYFVLSLFGFSIGGSSFVTRTVVDGVVTLHSKATARDGVARFECLRSASGRCYYTVYARGCAPVAAHCRSKPIKHFAVAGGASRQIAGLQQFVLCVSANGALPGPDCRPRAPATTPVTGDAAAGPAGRTAG